MSKLRPLTYCAYLQLLDFKLIVWFKRPSLFNPASVTKKKKVSTTFDRRSKTFLAAVDESIRQKCSTESKPDGDIEQLEKQANHYKNILAETVRSNRTKNDRKLANFRLLL